METMSIFPNVADVRVLDTLRAVSGTTGSSDMAKCFRHARMTPDDLAPDRPMALWLAIVYPAHEAVNRKESIWVSSALVSCKKRMSSTASSINLCAVTQDVVFAVVSVTVPRCPRLRHACW